jgi:hypothetical protein
MLTINSGSADRQLAVTIMRWAGWLSIASFFATWGFCIVELGPLMGFGLGWFPASVVGAAVFLLVALCIAGSAKAATWLSQQQPNLPWGA